MPVPGKDISMKNHTLASTGLPIGKATHSGSIHCL
jgi:hypothetical protein